MKLPRLVRRPAALASALLLLNPAVLFAGPNLGAGNTAFPDVKLQQNERSQAAVDALGTHLPAVANAYGLKANELRTLLLTDPSLVVDLDGRLHYTEPEPAPAVNPKSPKGNAAATTLNQTFQLHSRPGAKRTIYLDFDGHVLSGTAWNNNYNGGADIVAPPFDLDGSPSTFNDAELSAIQQIWLRVSEDYAPFDVDVTTELTSEDQLTRTAWADEYFGNRILISPISQYFGSYGGLSYVGAFDDIGDTYKTSLVFPERLQGNEKYIGEAAAHECGHAVGLNHDGLTSGDPYYTGHGTGETSWAPLMGAGYYANLTQWSRGEYAYANNSQDDLAVMQTFGLGYRADDHGNTSDTATAIPTGATFSVTGVIGRNTDVDVFSFTLNAAQLNLNAVPDAPGPNLDIALELRDATGSLILSSAPDATLSAGMNTHLEAGTYFLSIRGSGLGDPLGTGYTAYASLGHYTITGTVTDDQVSTPVPPVAVAVINPQTGIAGQTTFTFNGSGSYDTDGTIVSYQWTFGDGTQDTGVSVSKVYAQAGSYQVTLTVTDNSGLTHATSGSVSVQPPPNVPPTAVISASQTSGPAPLAITFNGTGSSDPDGTIASYAWNFGDGTTGSGATVSKTYSTAGNYTAVLTVTDNSGATASSSVVIQVGSAAKTVRVQSIALALVSGPGKNTTAVQSTSRVVDPTGAPVSGVKVTIKWSGAVTGNDNATTDANGYAVTTSKALSGSGTVTFTVTALTKTGYTYNPADNVVTSATISAAAATTNASAK